MFVRLKCSKCDNADCPYARFIVDADSEEGCTREVSEEVSEEFQHYMNEVLPFVRTMKTYAAKANKLDEIYGFLNKIYAAPVGRLLNAQGKALSDREAAKRLNRTLPSRE